MDSSQFGRMSNFFAQQAALRNTSSAFDVLKDPQIHFSNKKIPDKSQDKPAHFTQFFKQDGQKGRATCKSKTKWDTFTPYAYLRLSQQKKDESFMQLYDEFQGVKIRLNEQIDKNKKAQSRQVFLEGELRKLKENNSLPVSEKLRLEKEKNHENAQLKEEIKRLHEKISALIGNKHYKTNTLFRPQSAQKAPKTIFPVTQNIKAELQQQKKHVRELLLIIDQLKKNKLEVEDQLKEKQRDEPVRERQTRKNDSRVMLQNKSQNISFEMQSWKSKYSDLQISFNRMSEEKDKKLRQLQLQIAQMREEERARRSTMNLTKTTQISAGILEQKNKDLQDQVQRLESELRRLVNMPFMSNNRDAAETMEKYSKLELAFSKLKEELAKTRDKSTEYYTELQFKNRENALYKAENEKLKKQLKQTFQKQTQGTKTTSTVDYDDYYRKLLKLVKLQGNDPVWRKYANLAMTSFVGLTAQQIKNQAEQLWNSKLELLAHLQKAQVELATIKKSSDSKMMAYVQENESLQEQLRVVRAKLDEWLSMQKISGQHRDYQVYEQNGIKYDDTVSVFETEEQELKGIDANFNLFDLYFGQLNINETEMLKNPQNKIKSLPHMVTFATIDFYNHQTQHSDFLEGNNKKFSNNYSFIVEMDSQFIKYMTKNCLNVELWSPQGTATVLLGKGQIWLNDILNRSVKNISAIVRGKCPIYQPNNSLIANIEYRMRMRLPIGPYLQWAQTTPMITGHQAGSILRVEQRKILVVTILRAQNLPQEVNAFVYLNFQNEDYFTEPQRGPNPLWDFHREINVTLTEQLRDQMKQKYLELTIFDDDKSVNEDVIGIAKASLTRLLDDAMNIDLDLQIRNDKQKVVGKLKVKFGWLTQ